VPSLALLDDLVGAARRAGADAADALLYNAASVSLSVRLGQTQTLERSESGDLGLRVLIGCRQAVVSSADRSPAALAALVDRAVAMARAVPADPYCGLADPAQLATHWLDLDTFDPVEPSADQLLARAGEAEAAALAVPGVTNSEGGDASWGASTVALVASNGFSGAYSVTRHHVSAAVLAGSGTGMERDYDQCSTVYGSDQRQPASIGRCAGERAVQRLNPRKVPSRKVPVVFHPRVAGTLLGHLVGAINGVAIARKTSFLMGQLGQPVFAPGVTIIDDPFRPRGLRSRPFDGEGVATATRLVVDGGRLTTWLLDLRSARQLGLLPTGHAARGTGGPPTPSPANFYLAPGTITPAALMADIDQGLYVTELLGSGVNGVTGDYSRGAAGFWIERGKLTGPVSEVTIAGNLKEMYRTLTPADDLVFRYGIDAPTVLIESMTLAGV